MSKIKEITPVRTGMTREEAEEAVKLFLQDVLTSENMLKQENITTSEFKVVAGGRRYELITMEDGSRWVQGDKGLERFIGADYLEKNLDVEGWGVVKTKFFFKDQEKSTFEVTLKSAESEQLKNLITLQSSDFISVSKYVGDKKPDYGNSKLSGITTLIEQTGFHDLAFNANLREQEDGSIILIDTEYGSFKSDGVSPMSAETESELAGLEFTFNVADFFS